MPEIQLPTPTAWPFVMAFGVALTFAGLVTHASISALGLLLAVCAAVGWFREVLPEEAHESVPVGPVATEAAPAPVATATVLPMRPREVARVVVPAYSRAALPREIYPVSAGLRGGLAGCVVMALLAMAYGVVSRTSVWYPINLLAAGFLPPSVDASTLRLEAFNLRALALATAIHLIASFLVGLLYGAMLPMLPRRPVLLGGLVAPLFWSGLLYGLLGVINPVMNQRIDWPWFVLSQVGFGLAAGAVVARMHPVPTAQPLPFVVRAGIEAPGLMRERRRQRESEWR